MSMCAYRMLWLSLGRRRRAGRSSFQQQCLGWSPLRPTLLKAAMLFTQRLGSSTLTGAVTTAAMRKRTRVLLNSLLQLPYTCCRTPPLQALMGFVIKSSNLSLPGTGTRLFSVSWLTLSQLRPRQSYWLCTMLCPAPRLGWSMPLR